VSSTLPSPLGDSTNRSCPLELLASVVASAPVINGTDVVLCEENLDSVHGRQACPSRAGSSRSSSPSVGVSGKLFICRKCHREYASTDAVRKHARQTHAEWIKAQGQGCPSLYCMVVDTGAASDAGPLRQVTFCSTPETQFAPKIDPANAENASLFTVAESFMALSQCAAAVDSFDDVDGAENQPSAKLAKPKRSTGIKRPRSVRCGKCEGCERDDCGECKNCLDKPKFGGIGQRKQGCIKKVCQQPTPGA